MRLDRPGFRAVFLDGRLNSPEVWVLNSHHPAPPSSLNWIDVQSESATPKYPDLINMR
jgi:hypothetical protein